MSIKLTVCVDFDGVLNNYRIYDEDDLSTPREGARGFLEKLSKDYHVVILTARKFNKVLRWLDEHDLLQYVENVTNIKPPAVAYIDDRGLRFNGDYDEILEQLEDFKPYWK